MTTLTINNAKRKKSGFTLIEVIAVLVVLGILAAIALPRYVDLQENARQRAIDAGVAELNGREALNWANIQISTAGYVDDAAVWATMTANSSANLNLNTAGAALPYAWDAAPTAAAGGRLSFQGSPDPGVLITRTPSSVTSPAIWSR